MEKVAFDGTQPVREVGFWTYTPDDDAWWWSDEVYALHGYGPREVPATTDVLLHHKHPDDRDRAHGVLETAADDGEPFSCYHRIVDRAERVHSVLAVGRGLTDESGRVHCVEGYFVDLSDPRRSETEAEVQAALAGIAEHRSTIDMAKGVVRAATGCTSDEAFDLLRSFSQDANLKLRDVAGRLMDELRPDHHGTDVVMPFLRSLVPSRRRVRADA